MKKTLAFFLAFFLSVSAPSVFAQVPLTSAAAVPAAPAFEKIGVVAAVQGKIELKMPGQVGRIAQSGQPVFMGDEVNTSDQGHLQILLLDETVFTIGPNSTIIIDKFVYDPKSRDGEIRASIAKGVFRYVSGKIAAKKPNNVTVKLPTATLGFRGTIVGGSVQTNGQGLLGLLGPGGNNDAGATNGNFTVQGQGGDQQEVNRTGFGVEVNANGGLSGVFQLSNDQINGLTGGLMPSGSGGQGGGGNDQSGGGLGGDTNMGDLSGESNVLTGQSGAFTSEFSSLSEGMDDTSSSTAQYSAEQSAKVSDGTTLLSELSQITTGVYHYAASGTFVQTMKVGSPSAYIGTVSTSIDINFGSKTIGGGNSYISIDTTGAGGNISTGSVGVAQTSFASGVAPYAIFLPSVNSAITATMTLQNLNGVIAEKATTSVSYDNHSSTSSDIGSGGTVASRVSGETTGQQFEA